MKYSEDLSWVENADLRSAREEERVRIAREIHDEIGQSLAVLKMDLSDLKESISSKSQIINEKFRDISRSVDDLAKMVKNIASELRPEVIDELGLKAAAEALVKNFTLRTGVAVNFECSFEAKEVNPEVSTALYRIMQEALTNTIRHTRSKVVDISLFKSGNSYSLRARDYNESGAISYEGSERHLGILGMKERALILGGSFSIENNGGTIVKVEIPQSRSLVQ